MIVFEHIFLVWIRIFGRSGSGIKKKADPDPGKKTGSETLVLSLTTVSYITIQVPVDRIQQIISGIYESGSTALILFSPLVTEHSLYKNSIFTDSDLQHNWELVFNVLTEYKNVT